MWAVAPPVAGGSNGISASGGGKAAPPLRALEDGSSSQYWRSSLAGIIEREEPRFKGRGLDRILRYLPYRLQQSFYFCSLDLDPAVLVGTFIYLKILAPVSLASGPFTQERPSPEEVEGAITNLKGSWGLVFPDRSLPCDDKESGNVFSKAPRGVLTVFNYVKMSEAARLEMAKRMGLFRLPLDPFIEAAFLRRLFSGS